MYSTTSYRSSIETIALNSLVFEKIAFLHFDDRQTDEHACRMKPLSRRLNKHVQVIVLELKCELALRL